MEDHECHLAKSTETLSLCFNEFYDTYMKVIIAGSTGMIGGLIVDRCLQSSEVTEVVSLVRSGSSRTDTKLTEVIITDFQDYSDYSAFFNTVQAGFFCIGVYTGQVPKSVFETITVDYPVAFAQALHRYSPQANLCLLSGAGADRTEKSRTAFARFKGMAENRISALGVRLFSFRPAYIYPVEKRVEPNLMYRISRRLYPVIRMLGKSASITSFELASAMFQVGLHGADREVLENKDILDYVL